jgi:putative ABC transport system substrate-binding protein
MLSIASTAADMAGPQPRNSASNALLIGLRELGYVYGDHFVTEPRSPEGQVERFPGLVAELVRLQVDVIVAAGPALAALKQGTSTIPIVMAGAEDPVGLGVVKSLAHPGTNFTGLSNQAVELTVKRLELLQEIAAGVAPVAVLWDPASRLGMTLLPHNARTLAELTVALAGHHPGARRWALRV